MSERCLVVVDPMADNPGLYLNVYAPSTPAPADGRAVLFWVSPGSTTCPPAFSRAATLIKIGFRFDGVGELSIL